MPATRSRDQAVPVCRATGFTAVLTLALAAACLPINARAGWDANASLAARTFPTSLFLAAEGGYGQMLWGERKPGEILYGYVRPSASVGTVGIVNRLGARVDVYPISILGVSGGYEASWRSLSSTQPTGADCAAVECDGWLGRAFVKAQALGGWGPLFATLSYRLEWYRDRSRAFFDEIPNIVGARGGERLATLEAVAGVTITPAWSAGAYLSHARFATSGDRATLAVAYGALKWRAFEFLVGAGAWGATRTPWSPTAVGGAQWAIGDVLTPEGADSHPGETSK